MSFYKENFHRMNDITLDEIETMDYATVTQLWSGFACYWADNDARKAAVKQRLAS